MTESDARKLAWMLEDTLDAVPDALILRLRRDFPEVARNKLQEFPPIVMASARDRDADLEDRAFADALDWGRFYSMSDEEHQMTERPWNRPESQ